MQSLLSGKVVVYMGLTAVSMRKDCAKALPICQCLYPGTGRLTKLIVPRHVQSQIPGYVGRCETSSGATYYQ